MVTFARRPEAAPMTRCHGTPWLFSLSESAAMAKPTWRAARGWPPSAATAPYVVTRPCGMRRTTR